MNLDEALPRSPQYDVIIVGGGTAGCVLAARLSIRAPSLKLLLLEAGPNNNEDSLVRTPLPSRRMFGNPNYDWCLRSVPQKGLNGRTIEQTRGKMLGGSSAINSHSLVYPNREMHDAWASLIGDDRWGWSGIEPYYRKFQHIIGDGGSTQHDGPIQASFPRELNQVQLAWNSNGRIDYHERYQWQWGAKSCCDAYLRLAGSNLTIETAAHVEKVVTRNEGSDVIAEGVFYRRDEKRVFAKATREVILCAGVFGSPQILELSGIGQRDILEAANIQPVLELAGVGENLQDHLNYGPSVEVRPEVETLDSRRYEPSVVADHQRQYDTTRGGVLAEGAAYSFAYWPLQLFNDEHEEQLLRSAVAAHKATHPASPHNQYIYDSLLSPEAASATVFMTRMARYAPDLVADDGNTHTRSAVPGDPPLIDPRYLSDDLDVEVLARHVVQLEKLLQLSSFRDVVLPDGRRFPRTFSKPEQSSEDVKEAIREHGATNYHPCGTCAMLPADAGGVVGSSLRVYGTRNLRVCDASIFPIIPRGNILSTVYAVAEKAVDMILDEWSA
ncbi:Versicolorin B synthase [Cyphellophora attinorum]|uniref:Versicolorin B synthase n=1 Tax=Cyphellophora attinorum TaxID=1664694 RepID=A0A0N1H1C9_9EURO|nr:Versicolorin B synthase [Phialophora attinorum]KPI34524.1 Versicolorin B synthase [Phialophora attinorum]